MTHFSLRQFAAIAAFASVAAGTPALAVTVSENDLGELSSSFSAPTEISDAITRFEGQGASSSYDFLSLIGIGVQKDSSLNLTFSAPDEIGYSYSSGGTIFASNEPFPYGWGGDKLGRFSLSYRGDRTQQIAFQVPDSYAGADDLYLGMYFTHGRDVSYSIDFMDFASSSELGAPDLSAPDVAAVPLPSAALLLLMPMAGLVAIGRKRRSA